MSDAHLKSEEKTEKKSSIKREIGSWVFTVLIGLGLAFIFSKFVIVNAYVPTNSMLDTIPGESRIFGSRLTYLFSDPKRFDIIVFIYPDSPPEEDILFVKRVIGLPGETVEIIEGEVFIDGSKTPLIDDFVRPYIVDLDSWGPATVPDNAYFVMGDNRTDSEDSRYWENTFVIKDAILGRVFCNYWPSFKWHARYDNSTPMFKSE